MPYFVGFSSRFHASKADVCRACRDELHLGRRRKHKGLDLVYRIPIKFKII